MSAKRAFEFLGQDFFLFDSNNFGFRFAFSHLDCFLLFLFLVLRSKYSANDNLIDISANDNLIRISACVTVRFVGLEKEVQCEPNSGKFPFKS